MFQYSHWGFLPVATTEGTQGPFVSSLEPGQELGRPCPATATPPQPGPQTLALQIPTDLVTGGPPPAPTPNHRSQMPNRPSPRPQEASPARPGPGSSHLALGQGLDTGQLPDGQAASTAAT